MCSRNPPGFCTQSYTVLVMVYNWSSVGCFGVGKPDHLLPETCYQRLVAKHNTTNQLIAIKHIHFRLRHLRKRLKDGETETHCRVCFLHACTEQSELRLGVFTMNPLPGQRPWPDLFRRAARFFYSTLRTDLCSPCVYWMEQLTQKWKFHYMLALTNHTNYFIVCYLPFI